MDIIEGQEDGQLGGRAVEAGRSLDGFDSEDLAVGGGDQEMLARGRDAVGITEEEDQGGREDEEERGQAAPGR